MLPFSLLLKANSNVFVYIKPLLISALILIAITANSQPSENGLPAFDPTIHFAISNNTKADLSTSLSVGITGNRLPISLLIGGNFMEFEKDYQHLGFKKPGTWGLNATAMLRLFQIDPNSIDFNVYSTLYRQQGKLFTEYGGKASGLLNDRTRMYFSVGYLNNKSFNKAYKGYNSIVFEAGFSLFTF